MKAAVFHGVGDIRLERKAVPTAHAGEAVIRVTLTTICGTDLHILRGEYPVEKGLTIGHEAVGVMAELGEGVVGFRLGERVLVEAATRSTARKPNLRVPYAQANLAAIPDGVTDEQALMLADIASTGISGAESAGVRPGDAVVVFAQGPSGRVRPGSYRSLRDGEVADAV